LTTETSFRVNIWGEVLEVMLGEEDIVDDGGGVSGGGERVC
jgi:hypothetical protein